MPIYSPSPEAQPKGTSFISTREKTKCLYTAQALKRRTCSPGVHMHLVNLAMKWMSITPTSPGLSSPRGKCLGKAHSTLFPVLCLKNGSPHVHMQGLQDIALFKKSEPFNCFFIQCIFLQILSTSRTSPRLHTNNYPFNALRYITHTGEIRWQLIQGK